MSRLYLIRHGRTEANEKKLYCGITDLPLSDSGICELQQIHYQIPSDCLFLTSGMKRTEQTLQILFGDVIHIQDERFREINFGLFEMKGYEELKDHIDYQQWLTGDNIKNIPPGGESGEQMFFRVQKAVHELLKQSQNIVVITHGGVIAAIMSYLFPLEEKNRYEWQPQPGHGYVIEDGHYQELIPDENCI